MVDIVLERRGCITKTERHHKGFEKTKTCDKGCFPFVTLSDTELIECGDDVELGIDLGVAKSVQGFSY